MGTNRLYSRVRVLFVNEHGIIKVLNMPFTAGERRTTKLPYSRATNAMQRGEWLTR